MDSILRDLVAIPSITGHEPASEKAVSYVDRFLRTRGLNIQRYSSNGFPSLVATTRKTKRPRVVLAGHLDVVSAPPELFQLRLEDGKYFGRGVWDMKFAAALYLRLADELQDRLKRYDFGIMLTTDEETYGQYGTGMLLTQQKYRPDVAILPDAIQPWHIQASAKGCYFGEIKVLGISAHGSRPWEGDSASFKLVHILEHIITLFKDAQKPETMTLNIGILQAGNTCYNQIPDTATGTLDIRFTDQAQFETTLQAIQAICEKSGGQLKPIGDLRSAVRCDLRHPHVRSFLKQVQLQRGTVPPSVAANGTSDARFFAAMGIPCILLSPDGGGFHGNNEWLDQASYEQYYRIIREYIEDVARDPLAPVDRRADLVYNTA